MKSDMGRTRHLLDDLRHEGNCRSRGRKARLIRLAEAGLIRPLTSAEIDADEDRYNCAWPKIDPDDARSWASRTADWLHEAKGGIYHACTVRVKNGTDPDLPTRAGVGCRITRVPLSAWPYEDEGDVVFIVTWGKVFVGAMACSYDHTSATADEAVQAARRRLLAQGDCFETRAQARAAVVDMLTHRTGTAEGGA